MTDNTRAKIKKGQKVGQNTNNGGQNTTQKTID
jgi:hypothetical protein